MMATIHFLNVRRGDCSVIQHGSGRVTMIDICNGKSAARRAYIETALQLLGRPRLTGIGKLSGDFGMREHPTDPVAYLQNLGVRNVFRFILSHPDMDHLDGFRALCDEVGVQNFWDSGVRKAKPAFAGGHFNEEDWDHYVKVRDGRAGVTVVTPLADSRFQFANRGDPADGGDYLSIVGPDASLVQAANQSGDVNDGSYIIVYRSCAGRFVFPGDAHDKTWEYVLAHHEDIVRDCAVLIAPHHGRASGRSYEFLDVLNPGLTLFGCADSEDLAYDAWNRRDLFHLTNNQAGNIVLQPRSAGIEVFVENTRFGQSFDTFDATTVSNGCSFIGQVPKPLAV